MRALQLLMGLLAVTAFHFSAEAAVAESMEGELRLHAPGACGLPLLEFDAAPFGDFEVHPGGEGGEPGTVSFSVPGGTLTAEWLRDNGVRGVDPTTGRPTARGAPPGASCTTGTEPDCWAWGEPTAINASAFDAVCALSKGFTTLDGEACAFTLFNSQNPAVPGGDLYSSSPSIAVALSSVMSGQDPDANAPFAGGGLFFWLASYGPPSQAEVAAMTAGNPFPAGVVTPLMPLVMDSNDGPFAMHPIGFQNLFTQFGLSRFLTDEQEALLGCGPFYGTSCDIEGLGLMRSELSALLQSWPRPEESAGEGGWDTTDPGLDQPGTAGFEGEPVCTRYEGSATSTLPGCRGPGDPGYDSDVDGSTSGPDVIGDVYQRVHPFTGQTWSNEMAALSWNFLEEMVAFSTAADPGDIQVGEFDPDDPFRLDGCSFANPLACCNVAIALSSTTRAPEGDSSQPPLRRWLWEAGAEYLVTEAIGDLEDFLGWTLFALGPEQSRVSGAEVGLPFLLSPPDPSPPIPDSPLIVYWAGLDGLVGTDDDSFAGVAYGVVLASGCDDGLATTLELGSPGIPPGGLGEVAVVTTDALTVGSTDVAVDFDPSVLQAVSASSSFLSGFTFSIDNTGGRVTTASASASGDALGGGDPLLTVRFTSASGVAPGTTTVVTLRDVDGDSCDDLAGPVPPIPPESLPYDQVPGEPFIWTLGDVDCDGTLSAIDASVVLGLFVGSISDGDLPAACSDPAGRLAVSDWDLSGALTPIDASVTLGVFVGLIDPFCDTPLGIWLGLCTSGAAMESRALALAPEKRGAVKERRVREAARVKAKLRVDRVRARPGEEVTLAVTTRKALEVGSSGLSLGYDASALEVVSVESGLEGFLYRVDAGAGVIHTASAGLGQSLGAGEALMRVVFRVKPEAQRGRYRVSVQGDLGSPVLAGQIPEPIRPVARPGRVKVR